ncbi:DUF3099 domain-containing protein [Brevibacterium casei]|uniref:DUF3099 domain-containing protein n=1 Tax=Brevibacterium casei TaxID=33889 RepID=A0AB34XSI8_9MICO|nr:DUF3099 domain-containing protein [Brevibacterium casei]KZE18240.1 hypothetical protein AVW13_02110 [Brevibacterium casei]
MSRHPQQITTADTALDDDMKSRIIKYSITMTIRTLCFVAAYFAFAASQHVLMWIFVAGAVLLPYPAVIFANAGRERSRDDRSALIDSAPLTQLPPGRGETVSEDGTTVIDGETVIDEATSDEARGDDGREHLFTADIDGEVVDEGDLDDARDTDDARGRDDRPGPGDATGGRR